MVFPAVVVPDFACELLDWGQCQLWQEAASVLTMSTWVAPVLVC